MRDVEALGGFEGTDRYRVERCLGRGAFGVVYEVFDRLRQESVALKTLHNINADSLYGLKREFRTLADVNHPNLVTLYELSAVDDLIFFTMELVDGYDFLSFIYGAGSPADAPADAPADSELWGRPTVKWDDTTMDGDPDSPSNPLIPQGAQPRPAHVERLRSSLIQIVDGVSALHGANLLHRDIKPSNVLVAGDGQVKIADFGLSVELKQENKLDEVVGTMAYIAPEILLGEEATTASDWYAFGTMLYEALSGALPFTGGLRKFTCEKMMNPPRPVEEVAPEAPEDLQALCMDLIRRTPKGRLTGEEINRRLTETRSGRWERPRPGPRAQHGTLIGRDFELETMHRALESSQRGSTVVLRVSGAPGVGKTALVSQFLAECDEDQSPLVLRGRCFERESLPYRAVDSLMDSLTTYLMSVDDAAARRLLPDDVRLLSRLFPVMERAASVEQASGDHTEIPDRQELRLRAFHCLREILRRIGEGRPLILWLDDLQWSDADSAALLAEVLCPPEPPQVLLIASYRPPEPGLPPAMDRALASPGTEGDVETVELDRLSLKHSFELARAVLPDAASVETAEAIAAESGGNPIFIVMLAAHIADPGARLEEQVTLEQVIDAQVRALTGGARRLLMATSLSHRQPLPLTLARRAAELDSGLSDAVALLRSRRLLGTLATDGDDDIQIYHDRIRECLIAGLDIDEMQEVHARLARALEQAESPDPEALAAHLMGARERQGATRALLEAARLAAEKLAFDRASRLYGRALLLGGLPWSEERQYRVLRGDALKNAGRGPEAAREYLRAVTGASKAEALELRRRAVELLLLSGHTNEGHAMMRELLGELGISAPRSKYGVIVDIGVSQLWIRAHEAAPPVRRRPAITDEERLRLDVTWSTTWGLSLIEPVEARALQCRHLLDTLRVGDTYCLTRALIVEVALATTLGELEATKRSSRLVKRCRELVEEQDDPYTTGLWMLTQGMRVFFAHRFTEVLRICDEATSYLRTHCVGVGKEVLLLRLFIFASLYYRGDLEELKVRVRRSLRETRAAGDLVGSASMSGGVQLFAWLVDDDLETARHVLRESRERLGPNRFAHGNFWDMYGEGLVALYGGHSVAGYHQLRARWREYTGSGMNLLTTTLVPTLHLRGALALAAGMKQGTWRAHLDASHCARKLESMAYMPGALSMALFLRAGVAYQRGNHDLARTHLLEAEEESTQGELMYFAEVARLRRGQIVKNPLGDDLAQQAHADMRARGVAKPLRLAQLIAPGFG